MTSTFWGLRLEPGKRYSTTVDKSFHVSMAALDCNTVKNEKDIHCVMLEEGESNMPFILCNLQKPKVLQSRLNLNFESGDKVTFFCRGSGTVHLTGYIMPEDDDVQFGEDGEEVEEEEEVDEEEEEEDDEDEDEEKEVAAKIAKINGKPEKRKGESDAGQPAKKKKQAVEQDSEDDSEDDDDIDEEGDAESDSDNEEEEEQADSDETEEEAKPPVVQEEVSKKKKKKNKKQQGSPTTAVGQQQQGKQKQNPALNGPQQSAQQQQKKKQQQQQGVNEKQGIKKVVEGGVIVQDTKIGNGPVCKPGKMATVYYTGRLKSNNKVFDSTTQGTGFKFRVGRGEVIKGWDVGLAGMKVGGKRLITCPPQMGYGQKGMPPTIPGNSSLVFEVELKAVQ